MDKEKTLTIFKEDPMSKLIFSLSRSGLSLLINRIIPVSNPILANTSEISIIELAIE